MYHPITMSRYNLLLEAYRECPGNASYAMRKAVCGRPMAGRAWYPGWTDKFSWARPIRDVLAEEREAARAEQSRQDRVAREVADIERDKTRQDAVKTLVQEGQMLAAGRANVLAELASATQALPAMKKIIEQVRDGILSGAAMTPTQGVRLFREFNLAIRYMVEAADRLIEAERRSKGEPSTIIGISAGDTMSVEDAQREMEEVTALYALAKERGLVGDVQVQPAASPNGGAGEGSNGGGPQVH